MCNVIVYVCVPRWISPASVQTTRTGFSFLFACVAFQDNTTNGNSCDRKFFFSFFLYFLVFLHSPKVISCHFAWWDISFIFFTFLNVFFSTSLRARFTSHSCIRTPLRSAFLSWMLGMGLVELREQLHPVARVPTEATLMKNSKFKLICSVGMPHASGSCSGFRFNLLVFFS